MIRHDHQATPVFNISSDWVKNSCKASVPGSLDAKRLKPVPGIILFFLGIRFSMAALALLILMGAFNRAETMVLAKVLAFLISP